MTEVEKNSIPQLTTEELVQHVFRDEYGKALMIRWLGLANLTGYNSAPKDHEAYIRQDERQRFVFSIFKALALTEDQLYEFAQQRAEAANLRTQKSRTSYE